MKDMMEMCMKRGRWFPLMPLPFGIILFLFGYFLDAEIIRIIWLIFSSLMILMGIFGLIVANMMMRHFSPKCTDHKPE